MSAIKHKIDNYEDAYHLDLSPEEMQFIASLLPVGYSFQLEPKSKKK